MSTSPGHLVALATKILEQAKELEAYHANQSIPLPSFDESATEAQNFPKAMEKTRATISDACEELNALVQDPRLMMQSRVMVGHPLAAIHTLPLTSLGPHDLLRRHPPLQDRLQSPLGPLDQLLRPIHRNRRQRSSAPPRSALRHLQPCLRGKDSRSHLPLRSVETFARRPHDA